MKLAIQMVKELGGNQSNVATVSRDHGVATANRENRTILESHIADLTLSVWCHLLWLYKALRCVCVKNRFESVKYSPNMLLGDTNINGHVYGHGIWY